MKKGFICFAVMLGILGSTFAAGAFDRTEAGITATPRYAHIAMMSAGLDISNWGGASCSGTVSVDPGYHVSATLELKKSVNGTWTTMESWTGSGSGVLGADIDGSYWVDKGMYMAKLTAYVTDASGNFIEQQYVYSLVREYR